MKDFLKSKIKFASHMIKVNEFKISSENTSLAEKLVFENQKFRLIGQLDAYELILSKLESEGER